MKFEPKLNEALIEKEFLGVSTHTGGEITRIIMDGFPVIPGTTMIEKKNFLIDNYTITENPSCLSRADMRICSAPYLQTRSTRRQTSA